MLSQRFKPNLTLPQRLHLPSGRKVAIERGQGAAPVQHSLRGAVLALSGNTVLIRSETGKEIDPETLALEDFQVLRAVATVAGLLPENSVQVPCDNCDVVTELFPCDTFEPFPFLDGELKDPELDQPFPFEEVHRVPEGAGKEHFVKLRRLTVGDARALHEAIDSQQLRVTSAVVLALGLESVNGESDEAKNALWLQQASDEVWNRVTDLFDAAHYGPRLRSWWRCGKCGARNDVDAPALREFPALPLPRCDGPVEGFPSEEDFEDLVLSEAERVLREQGVSNLAVTVEFGVADCDEGGVPLLGSYDPGPTEPGLEPERGPEVRIYYRTFRAMFAEERYDYEREVAETLHHEVRHHLAFLAGYDREDETEQEEIALEEARKVGETEVLRRASRAAGADLVDFFRQTWPVWLLVAGALTLVALLSR